ncbi:O-antigen translocase [Sphingomonas sp. IC-11]|uniref:O-antigen translocase n=1 Tax=Sphingomonas sp. IC-11 TaxID=2898528 RepID=UPI001E616011|nr:O-antigen translocase [Sphingomonas sp. IC-11]MCD2317572.1 O-antigen translocase [Sphingomonas sp. IC-11]
MSLIRTSFWNGIAVAVRMGTALLLNKILAIYVGPSGYAIIGQFQNLVGMIVTFATGATNTGVVKYTAELFDDEASQRRLWQTAGTVTLIASLISAVAIVLARDFLARELLHDPALASIFLWLAAGLVFISLNALLLALLNGKKEVKRYVVSNIAGSFIGLAVTGALAYWYGLYGTLVALSINQALVFFVTFHQVARTAWFRLRYLVGRIDRRHLRALGGFVAMAAASAIAAPLSQVAVRNDLAAQFGWDYAGYWDAMWRISTIYLTFVTVTLSLYYLPRLSEIRDPAELRREILGTYRIVVPAVTVVSLTLYLLRDLVIAILFTGDFAPMEVLFSWQMAGDVVKISSWVLSFVMLGRGMTRLFIVTELLFAVSFWASAALLTRLFGFEGVAMAHLANYAVYMVAMWYLILVRSPETRPVPGRA